jgi:predicted transposase YdaD
MRMDRAQATRLFQGARAMRDSTVYQGILEEGRAEGRILGELTTLRRTVRRQGEQRFGPLRPEHEAALNEIIDTARLDRLAIRVLIATDWNDLLSTP